MPQLFSGIKFIWRSWVALIHVRVQRCLMTMHSRENFKLNGYFNKAPKNIPGFFAGHNGFRRFILLTSKKRHLDTSQSVTFFILQPQQEREKAAVCKCLAA